MLGEKRQELGRCEGLHGSLLETLLVPGDQVVGFRCFRTGGLDRILKVWPIQSEGMAEAILVYGHHREDVQQVGKHTPGLGFAKVLGEKVVEGRDSVRGKEALNLVTLSEGKKGSGIVGERRPIGEDIKDYIDVQ